MTAPHILHVDMDAFYAAVEVRDDPSLAGLPLIVGGTGSRGVVAACSYEARAYGVHSAMPSARARALCPEAVFVAGRFERYREVSAAIHAVFEEATPVIEPIALDEAFLDVGGAQRLLGPAPVIARAVRARIAEVTGLSCSVGVSAVKFVAKLASEAAKPVAGPGGPRPGPGVVVVEPGTETAFLHPMPIEALWGVGPATAAKLRRLGLTTVGELAAVDSDVLERGIGRAHGAHLHRLSHAVDERPVVAHRRAKSIGHEETYARDHHDEGSCRLEVMRMADAVAARLRAAGSAGRTVTLKVRFGDFTTITRSRTSAAPIDSARAIAAVATALLSGVDVGPGVRLLGVSVSQLDGETAGAGPAAAPGEQLALALGGDGERGPTPRAAPEGAARTPTPVASQPEGWSAAADAIDRVRGRFGARSVGPASLLGGDGLRIKRQGDTRWGPSADHGDAARAPGRDGNRRRGPERAEGAGRREADGPDGGIGGDGAALP